MGGFTGILVALVIAGAIPLLVASYQFLLVAVHFRRLHYRYCAPFFPPTAVLIPAWNEGAAIGATVDRLVRLEYPRGSLRVFVIDDASTDETPGTVEAKVAQYPGAVYHLRREVGGQGKAHTLNHGLAQVLADDWAQAILITDSDVIFEPDSLRLMTRHLADPQTGAVTAYIREGSRPGNYLTRFIGYEYITAQAAARRSQNVLGAMACLAGGAQLHSRANIEAIGGRIDTGSLAEDTVTTFMTQLRGARVVFEPHAVVYAEEPGTIAGLWKQRLRWGRGNIQVTRRFWSVWFRPAPTHRLGGVSFAAFWFTLLVQPFLMICGSASLVTLYFLDRSLAWHAFHGLWGLNLVAYVFITSFALLIDPQTARHVWRQAILFPGLISLVIMLAAVLPGPMRYLAVHGLSAVHASGLRRYGTQLELFSYVWLAASMGFAYLAKVTETRLGGRFLSPLLVYLVGYGPLLCAVTLGAYALEVRHADASWQKTEKTGKMAVSG
jgi:cellulose synthase/poly-beta-1,6-N-acetylglucosamine synthase-like glycosyltransferase